MSEEIKRITTPKLSDEQKRKVQSWLKEKWLGPKTCPVSGHKEWVMGDHLIAPTSLFPNGERLFWGGSNYPQIMLICKGCGYTMFFNAVPIGILPEKEAGDAG